MAMHKKTFLAAIIISGLLLSLVGVQFVELAKANPSVLYPSQPNSDPPIPTIQEPAQNSTIYQNSLDLSFTVTKPGSWWYDFSLSGVGGRPPLPYPPISADIITKIGYIIDGKETDVQNINGTDSNGFPNDVDPGNPFTFLGGIGPLTNGPHVLQVFAVGQHFYTNGTVFNFNDSINWAEFAGSLNSTEDIAYASTYFTVDAPLLKISNLSIENKTYSSNAIPLSFNINERAPSWIGNFYINETASWIGYSLDNQAKVTIAGNITLVGLAEGSHSIVVYVNDTSGNTIKTETVFFTAKLSPAFTMMWVVVALVVVVCVSAVLAAIMFRRRQSADTGTKGDSVARMLRFEAWRL
jgi:hypothetical protein